MLNRLGNLLLVFLVAFFSLHSALSFAHVDSGGNDFFDSERVLSVRYTPYEYHLAMLDIRAMDLEVLGVDFKQQTIDLYLTQAQLDKLLAQGWDLEQLKNKNGMLGPDQDYKTPEEVESILKDYHARYPEISRLVSIGKSVEGRDIWALQISDTPDVHDPLEPTLLYNGMHHAREVMTPEVALDIANELLTHYGKDTEATRWVNENDIWIVPMLNVDGNNKVWHGSSMWRKNVAYGSGVDINRNYPFKWGACNGSSGSSWSDTYRGPSAGSEPETKALMGLVEKIRPVFNISYHSYSELVLYPYGCEGQKTETHEIISTIGKKMAELLDYTPGTPWEVLYGVDGGDVDWMYAVYQVIPFVIEVNSSREGFQPSYSRWRDQTVERNRVGWRYLMQRLEGSSVRGVVQERAELNAAQTILVEKQNKGIFQLVQEYKVRPDGSFHIILNPGEYQLTLKTNGRSTKTQTVSVADRRVDVDTL